MKIFILILIISLSNKLLQSQELQPFGLQDKVITSLTVEQADYDNLLQPSDFIFAGTKENGVYQALATDEFPNWTPLGLTNKPITALTLQHWGRGQVDGLRLFAAVTPDYEQGDSTLIFSRGAYLSMDTNWTASDSGIDGNVNSINALNSYYYTWHTRPGTILVGTSFGIYTGTSSFWNLSEVEDEGLQPMINSIDVTPHWWGNLAWAAGSFGITPAAFRSTNSGVNWEAFELAEIDGVGDTASSVAINTHNPDSVYVSWNTNIYLTPDNGENWESVFSSRGIFISSIAVDPLHPENVFAGGFFFDDSHQSSNHGIFLHSTNGGKDWIEHYTIDNSLLGNITSIAVLNKSDSTYVFIGTEGTGVWYYKYSASTNNDSSYFPLAINNEWNFTSNLFPKSERITDTLRINEKLYYGLLTEGIEPYILFRESDNKVFILDLSDSTEAMLCDFNAGIGESWPISEKYVCSFGLEITLVSKTDTVETPSGTFYNCFHFSHSPNCADAGITDTWLAKGVGKIRFKEIFYAGTGDFVLTDYIVTSIDNPAEPQNDISFKLFQNYPNPFNPSTTIKYELSKESNVQLVIYNILGQKVVEFVNSFQKSGRYEVEWNAERFASGVYIYQIVAGEFYSTKKLILLK